MDCIPVPTIKHSSDAPRDRAIQQIVQFVFQLVRFGSRRAAQALAPYDLTLPQYHSLLHLSCCGERCTIGELAEGVFQDAATMTGIVGRLEDRGLVRRQHGRTDRRKVFVTLQEPGQQIVEQVTRAWYQNGMTVFEDLDQEMLEQTVRILQMVLKRLQPEAVEYL